MANLCSTRIVNKYRSKYALDKQRGQDLSVLFLKIAILLYQCDIKITKKGGTLYYVSLLINNRSEDTTFYVNIIDGQNVTEISKYKQLNNRNNCSWNPCIPMPFGDVHITFLSNNDSIWRDIYPSGTCDYQNNSVNYKNEYLFDGHDIAIFNLIISDYVINVQRNYPIARARHDFLQIYHGSFINISSVISGALFYAEETYLGYCYMSNISAEMIILRVSKNT